MTINIEKIDRLMHKQVGAMFDHGRAIKERGDQLCPLLHFFLLDGGEEAIGAPMYNEAEKEATVNFLKERIKTGLYHGVLMLGDTIHREYDPKTKRISYVSDALCVSLESSREATLFLLDYKKVKNRYKFGQVKKMDATSESAGRFSNLFSQSRRPR